MPVNEADFVKLMEQMDLVDIDKLKRAKEAVAGLERRKVALLAQVADVDQMIVQVRQGQLDPSEVPKKERPAAATPMRPTRGKVRKLRDGGLGDHIRRFLESRGGKPANVKEITDGVLTAGYESTSKKLDVRVRTTLSGLDVVESAGRGLYRLAK